MLSLSFKFMVMALDADREKVGEFVPSAEDILLLDSTMLAYRGNFSDQRALEGCLQAAVKVSAVVPRSLCRRDPDLIMAMSRSAVAAVFAAWGRDKCAADPKKRAYVKDLCADAILDISAVALRDLSDQVDAARSAAFGLLNQMETSGPAAPLVLPPEVKTAYDNSLQKALIADFAPPVARGAYDFYLRERAESQLMIDQMTGLSRYTSVLPVILEMVAEGKSFAYFNLDFNLMKAYNTAFGHTFVDKLLRLSAQILTRNLRGGDFDLAWRRGDKADEYGVASRVPNFDHALRLGAKILQVLGEVKAEMLMSRQDYEILRNNYQVLRTKQNPDEMEIKALGVIEKFISDNAIDLGESQSDQSWTELPASGRDLERDDRLVNAPCFGWSVGVAFFDPREADFSGRAGEDVLICLEQRSEMGVGRLKAAGRPSGLFAISDSKGNIRFHGASHLASNPDLVEAATVGAASWQIKKA